jgi:hypothetical protein
MGGGMEGKDQVMGSLLKPAVNQTAFLKVGILGFEGSGKTHTGAEIAKGITQLVKGTKIAFFDTEKGSDFHIERFKKAGLELHVHKSKAFTNLCQIIREAEANGYSVLIIDSITHVWRELCDAYRKKNNVRHMNMRHWMNVKTEWAQYTDLYVNSKLHIIMCGRAGYEYDMDEDEDGKKEIVKSGVKMKVEGETGFEPDLLLEMSRVRKAEIESDKKAKGFINRAFVLKDRTDTINGRMIDFPKFKDFMSVVKHLNIGGEHVGTDLTQNSEDMFDSPDHSRLERDRLRAILLEEIQAVLIKGGLDGNVSADKKKQRIDTLEKIFGTSAKTAIETMDLKSLSAGVQELKVELGFAKAPELAAAGSF